MRLTGLSVHYLRFLKYFQKAAGLPRLEENELWGSRSMADAGSFPRPMPPSQCSTTIHRALLAALMLVVGLGTPAMAEGAAEYEQKASLICGLLRNVEWPSRKLKHPSAPFVIGIIGHDLVSDFLREDLQGRRIKERPVQIRSLASLQEIATCHLLFVSASENDRLRSILAEARREGILTVGESENFLTAGGVVQFAVEGTRVTYRVSQTNANRESLKLNGFVLRFSKPQAYARPRSEETNSRIAQSPGE